MRGRKREEGSYLVMGAVLLVVIFIAVAVGVDYSRKWRLEGTCQDVADAAALAGVAELPNEARAMTAITMYMDQAAPGYEAPVDDILMSCTADGTSGTVGVIVRGTWDSIFMPRWLSGDPTYNISRRAIAVMHRDTETFSSMVGDTLGATPAGRYAIFLGDTGPVTSTWNTNNVGTTGDVHVNHQLVINGNGNFTNSIQPGADGIYGTADDVIIDDFGNLEFVNSLGGGWENGTNNFGENGNNDAYTVNIDQAAEEIDMPEIDEQDLNVDLIIDINAPGADAVYEAGVTTTLLMPGDDGILGTGDDWPLMAQNPANPDQTAPVEIRYDGSDMWGHQVWTLLIPTGYEVTALSNPGIGAGVDIKVGSDAAPGDLVWGNDNNDLYGTVWTTGSLTIEVNNAKIQAAGDNPSLALYTGPPGDPNGYSMRFSGNHFDVDGVLYADGSISLVGNEPNPSSHDASGAFIEGAILARNTSSAAGGALDGQNWFVYYNADLIADLPTVPEVITAPPTLETPTVWLIE